MIFSLWLVLLFTQQQRKTFENGARERTLAILTAVDAELRSSITTLEALGASQNLETGDLAAFYQEATRIVKTQPGWFAIIVASPERDQLLHSKMPMGSSLPKVMDSPSFNQVLQTARPAIGSLHRADI